MKNKNTLNKLIQSASGKIVGTEVDPRYVIRTFGKPYKFSARILEETKDYVTFKPLSGKFKKPSKFHKKSIKKLTVSGSEYNRK